jgi:NADH:ubiquinone oxidoreductase subunit C
MKKLAKGRKRMELIEHIVKTIGKKIERIEIVNKEIICYIEKKEILTVMRFFKYNTLAKYEILIDITAVDYPSREERFEVIYQLLSISTTTRIRIKIKVDGITPIESITSIYPTAG